MCVHITRYMGETPCHAARYMPCHHAMPPDPCCQIHAAGSAMPPATSLHAAMTPIQPAADMPPSRHATLRLASSHHAPPSGVVIHA